MDSSGPVQLARDFVFIDPRAWIPSIPRTASASCDSGLRGCNATSPYLSILPCTTSLPTKQSVPTTTSPLSSLAELSNAVQAPSLPSCQRFHRAQAQSRFKHAEGCFSRRWIAGLKVYHITSPVSASSPSYRPLWHQDNGHDCRESGGCRPCPCHPTHRGWSEANRGLLRGMCALSQEERANPTNGS